MNHEVRRGAAGGCPGSPRLRAALRLAPRAAIGRPCGAGESIAAVLLTRRAYAVVRTRGRISLAAGARQRRAGPGTGKIRRHLEPETWNCRSYLTPWATQHILGLSRREGGRAGCGTIRSSWRGSRSICRTVSCPAAQADQGNGNEKSVLCPPNSAPPSWSPYVPSVPYSDVLPLAPAATANLSYNMSYDEMKSDL